MKKGIVIISAIIFIIVITSFLPITQNPTINISATFDNTILQVIHVENWKNWYPEIKDAWKKNPASYNIKKDSSQKIYTITIPGKKYIIKAVTPMSYKVTEEGRSKKDFAFSVFPGGLPNKMQVYLVEKSPLILTIFKGNGVGENAVNGLKYYLETPKELYGFEIQMAEIRDSIIASSVANIMAKNVFHSLQNVYVNLLKYLKANDLIKTGHISISYIPISNDSLQVTVGIPVNRKAYPAEGIKCLLLPGKGRVLVGMYQGKFSNRQKIYAAMSKYLTDHTLSIPAESFERYLDDAIPTSDSSELKMELNYPVY